jgi:hypothetical protein
MRQLLNIILLFGFFLLCSSATICHLYKLSTDEISAIANNIVEEEDETEKDTKTQSDEFAELTEQLDLCFIELEQMVIYPKNTTVVNQHLSKNTPPPKA